MNGHFELSDAINFYLWWIEEYRSIKARNLEESWRFGKTKSREAPTSIDGAGLLICGEEHCYRNRAGAADVNHNYTASVEQGWGRR